MKTKTKTKTTKPAKPYQPTLIREKTARSLAYLEARGLADFSGCNLRVVPAKRVRNGSDLLGLLGDHKDGVLVSITDGSPTGGV